MRRTCSWRAPDVALVLAILLAAGVALAADYDATVIVEAEEALRLAEAETIHGDLIVMGGKAYVLGRVEGNVLVVDGRATLGATARVDGDALTVRGEIERHELATITGEQRKLSAEEFARLMRGVGETAEPEPEDEVEEEPAEPEETEEPPPLEEAEEVEEETAGPIERTGDVTNYGKEIVIPEDEIRVGSVASVGGPIAVRGEVRGDVVNMGGPIRIYGTVNGSVATFGGTVYVYGDMNGDIAAFGGDIFLEDGCHVTGNVAGFGGSVKRAEGATLEGEEAVFGGQLLSWLLSLDRSEPAAPEPERRQPADWGPWIAGNVGALVLTLLIALIFPNATRTVADVIAEQPGSAAAHGAVTLLLAVLVCVVLAITCVGLLAVRLVLGLVGALDVLGIVAVNLIVGRKTARALNWTVGSVLGLAIIGALVLRLVAAARLAPLLGMIAGVVAVAVVVFGVGGAVMSRFGTDPTGTFITGRVHRNGTAAKGEDKSGELPAP